MKSKSQKPLLTFAVVAYNQEKYIREAIEGAFSQTYSPLEIILSDDCSPDRTFTIMTEMTKNYTGSHKVILNRNKSNLGIGAHINHMMEFAKGELIVVAAGDDISVPHRAERIYQIYEATNAKSIFSNCLTIDEAGNPSNLLYEKHTQHNDFSPSKYVHNEQHVAGCSHAWSRDVFGIFGPLMTPLICEDWVIPFRSALLGRVEYIDEVLVMHRMHGNNAWNYKTTTDVDKDIEFQKFWIFEKKAIYNNWLKDIRIMKGTAPLREKELVCFQNIIQKRLSDIEQKILMLNGRLNENIKIIAKNILKKGTNFKEIRHDIGFFLIPQIYRKYMILKSKCGT